MKKVNKIGFIIIIIFGIVLASSFIVNYLKGNGSEDEEKRGDNRTFQNISAKELKSIMDKRDILLVDVHAIANSL